MTMQRTADSMASLADLLDENRVGFRIEPIGLTQMPSWRLADGALSHVSGGFFSVVGVHFDATDAAPGGDSLYLFQPQSAINGLLTCLVGGERYFLLQARAEPGNVGQAQLGPTLQSTPANYQRVHGGRVTPYFEWFSRYQPGLQVVHDSVQLDLGRRYLFKSKRVVVVECAADTVVEPGFAWVPAGLLSQAALQSTFLNTDLRALLGVLPWGEGPQHLAPVEEVVQASLRLPRRTEALAELLQDGLYGKMTPHALVPIDAMVGWRVADEGIFEVAGRQGFDVGYYQIEARGREVAHWQQPLVRSRCEGCTRLLCRLVDGALEVCVQVAAEPGLQTGNALLPSYLRYPGDAAIDSPLPGKLLARTRESDEGGRFYQDASVYELVLVAPQREVAGCWLRLSELKALLSGSNICSIQLRVISSLLLAAFDF